jgi:hypothetical protein
LTGAVVALLVSSACVSEPAASPETGPSTNPATTAVDQQTTLAVPTGPDLPVVELVDTGASIPVGRKLTGSLDHLYYRSNDLGELVRLDGETYEETARISGADLPDPLVGPDLGLGDVPASYSADTVTMVAPGRHSVAFLEAETLDLRHLHEVGAEFRLGVANDMGEPHVWVSSYYMNQDAIAGIDNPMLAMELDPQTSTPLREVNLSFCGATAVVALDDDHLVAEIECTSNVEVINITSGEVVDVIPEFSPSVTLGAARDAVWATWPDSGEVARIDRATHEIVFMDLDPDDDDDYPTITRINRLIERDNWVWLSAKDVDERVIVMRVDPTTAEVTARAQLPLGFNAEVFFQRDRGVVTDARGNLSTFELADITAGAPERVHRPDRPVIPDAFEPATSKERAINETLLRGLDPNADFDDKVEFLVDGERVREQARIMEERGEGFEVTVEVLDVTIVDEIAVAPVTLVVDGAPIPPDGQPMRVELLDGRWKITSESICDLGIYIGMTACLIP